MKKIHKAWIMLAGCCLLQGGSMGLINNCRGIFFNPVVQDLGISLSGFTRHVLIAGFFTCLTMPFVNKLFQKIDSRIVLGTTSFLFAASVFLMGCMSSLPGFYIVAILQGITISFSMFYTAPYILGNWFKKDCGLAIGISSAAAGVIGILCNPIGNAIIQHFGWRMGYFSFGIAALLMMVPVSVFLLKLHPEDCGCKAYGEEEAIAPSDISPKSSPQDSGLTKAQVLRSPYFWLMIIAGILGPAVGCFNSYLNPYCVHLGNTAAFGASVTSISFIGNVLSKFLLGHLNDRYGVKKAILAGCSLSVAGILLLQISNHVTLYIAALLYGFSMGLGNIMCAIVTKEIYGLRLYGELLTFSTLALSLGNAIAAPIYGAIIDGLGAAKGYPATIWLLLVCMLVIALFYILAINNGRKMRNPRETV